MNIIDHGQDDAIPFELGDTWRVVARIGREAIEAQRIERNEREQQGGREPEEKDRP